jgi:hypothetical protein
MFVVEKNSTVELRLSGLIGRRNHSDMQKSRIIGFLIEKGLQWQFELEYKLIQSAFLGHIFISVQTKY